MGWADTVSAGGGQQWVLLDDNEVDLGRDLVLLEGVGWEHNIAAC